MGPPSPPKCQKQSCKAFLCQSCRNCLKQANRFQLNCLSCFRKNQYKVQFSLEIADIKNLYRHGVVVSAQAVISQIGEQSMKRGYFKRVRQPIYHCFLKLEIKLQERNQIFCIDSDIVTYDSKDKLKITVARGLPYQQSITNPINFNPKSFSELYNFLQNQVDSKDYDLVTFDCYDVATEVLIHLDPNCPGSETTKISKKKADQFKVLKKYK